MVHAVVHAVVHVLAGAVRELTWSAPPRRFKLLVRVRLARSFPQLPQRRMAVQARLLAFHVLFQSSLSGQDPSVILTDPEFVPELMGLLAEVTTWQRCLIWESGLLRLETQGRAEGAGGRAQNMRLAPEGSPGSTHAWLAWPMLPD